MKTVLAAITAMSIAAPASAQNYNERPPPPRAFVPGRTIR